MKKKIAKKEDMFFYKSFNKALKAIKSQLNKARSLKQANRQTVQMKYA